MTTSAKLVSLLANLMALEFEVKGMEAHNLHASRVGAGLYDETAFLNKAEEARRIAELALNEVEAKP